MANHYLIISVLILFTLHAATNAGGYNKEMPNSLGLEASPSPADVSAGPSAVNDKDGISNIAVVTPAPSKLSLDPQTNLHFKPLFSPYSNSHSFYQGIDSPHPGHISYYSGIFKQNVPSFKPGFPGSYIPLSTDYVSRYHGPGTVPVVLPDGTLADTPEVIAARAAHFGALQRAQALWYGPKDDGSYNPLKYGDDLAHGRAGPIRYPNPAYVDDYHHHLGHPTTGHLGGTLHNTPSSTVYTPPGFIGPTGHQISIPTSAYQGPLSVPIVLPSGYLADTPDVAAVREAHLGALARAHEEAALWRTSAD